jgi:4-diphosphocytidyl-2-C-methyl-D-erythritol kinase
VTSAIHPVINRIKDALLDQGAMGALMSGSGPTVFGMFETKAACQVAADSLSPEGWRFYPVETLAESPLAEFRAG